MADVKITKVMVLEAIKALVEDFQDAVEVEVGDAVVAVDAAAITEYCDGTIAQLAAKAEKAKAKAAEKRAEGDELRAAVEAVLTDEFQTREQITAQIDVADITPAKVGARLTQLVGAGTATKEQIKVGDRKVMGYKAVAAE